MTDETQDQSTPPAAPAPAPTVTRTHILNAGPLMVVVKIVNPSTGAIDEVFLQPGGKPHLPDGFVPDPRFLFKNPQVKVATVQVPAPQAQ